MCGIISNDVICMESDGNEEFEDFLWEYWIFIAVWVSERVFLVHSIAPAQSDRDARVVARDTQGICTVEYNVNKSLEIWTSSIKCKQTQ